MPVFVSLGRYSQNAIKAMLAKPEDRTAAVRELVEMGRWQAARLLCVVWRVGLRDHLRVARRSRGGRRLMRAAGAGAASYSVTMLAMTGAEAKAAFEAGRALGASYQAPGAS